MQMFILFNVNHELRYIPGLASLPYMPQNCKELICHSIFIIVREFMKIEPWQHTPPFIVIFMPCHQTKNTYYSSFTFKEWLLKQNFDRSFKIGSTVA